MDDQEPKRPWWKKKRWIAAGLLWLAVAHYGAGGMVAYAIGRGWLAAPGLGRYVYHTCFHPVWRDFEMKKFAQFCLELGRRHAASD